MALFTDWRILERVVSNSVRLTVTSNHSQDHKKLSWLSLPIKSPQKSP